MKNLPSDRHRWSVQMALSLAYILIIVLPLLTAMASPSWRPLDAFTKLGNGLILLVYSILALQPVLAARLKLLDRAFGLDIVYVFHKTMGMTAGALQVCAYFLLISRRGRMAPSLESAGTILVVILVLSALLYHKLHMTYETWRKLHNLLFVGLLFAVFREALRVCINLGNAPAIAALSGAGLLAAAAYTQHKFLGPSRRRKGLYSVSNIVQETRNVWTITIVPPASAERIEYRPGQFQFLTFDGGKGEEHPFTISSSPTQGPGLAATIKESGDFTRMIKHIKVDDAVAVQAPFGRFSHTLHPEEKDLVFIAGGIGITPLMSMLRFMRDSEEDRDVLLLYANNTEEDIAFRGELDDLAVTSPPRLRVVHVLSQAKKDWSGERGFIDRKTIENYAPGDLTKKTFYLCGPPAMMTALITTLINLGVLSRRIRSERFAL